jgi:hypothetical protein
MIRNRQRGFVLIVSLVLAVLYFGLMELLLIDSSRALNEAQRFRARVVAATLAESGAELAAQQIITRNSANVTASDFQGTMAGHLSHSADIFEIQGAGTAIGAISQNATVEVRGRIEGNSIKIDFTTHAQ